MIAILHVRQTQRQELLQLVPVDIRHVLMTLSPEVKAKLNPALRKLEHSTTPMSRTSQLHPKVPRLSPSSNVPVTTVRPPQRQILQAKVSVYSRARPTSPVELPHHLQAVLLRASSRPPHQALLLLARVLHKTRRPIQLSTSDLRLPLHLLSATASPLMTTLMPHPL